MSALPSTSPLPLTGDAAIDVATHGYYWAMDGTRTINWSLSNGFSGEYWYSPAATAQILSAAFDAYSNYANIKFRYVGYYLNPSYAYGGGSNINVSMDQVNLIFNSPSTYAWGFFPSSRDQPYAGAAGDIFLNLNSRANFLSSYTPGTLGFDIFIHEIGHTVGLKHMHDDGGTGRPTLSSLGQAAYDKDWVSIMSYNDDYAWNTLAWHPATPMILDVLGLQYLYGPNLSTNAGDTVYTLQRTNTYSTIWDAGGSDTVDARAATSAWTIALPNTKLSALVDTKAGLAYASSEVGLASPTTLYWLAGDIENATGSSYADTIAGNDLRNSLSGGLGNDTISGGQGSDTALYSASRAQYSVTAAGGSIIVSGPDGTDTLTSIERLKFANGTLALDAASDVSGQAFRLYRAALGRTPDDGGLGYQTNRLDQGTSLEDVGAGFIASPEFRAKYGALSNDSYVQQLYQNVLGRSAAASEVAYHVGRLTGGASRQAVLIGFSESPENMANVAPLVSGGIWFT